MLIDFIPKKRLPFRFAGEWGKVYKRFTTIDNVALEKETIITYESNTYVEIGVDIQFRRSAEITEQQEQPMKGLIKTTYYTTLSTTDAYFDSKLNQYRCCVQSGDIVEYKGLRWIVSNVQSKTRQNPSSQCFFYFDIKSIS